MFANAGVGDVCHRSPVLMPFAVTVHPTPSLFTLPVCCLDTSGSSSSIASVQATTGVSVTCTDDAPSSEVQQRDLAHPSPVAFSHPSEDRYSAEVQHRRRLQRCAPPVSWTRTTREAAPRVPLLYPSRRRLARTSAPCRVYEFAHEAGRNNYGLVSTFLPIHRDYPLTNL